MDVSFGSMRLAASVLAVAACVAACDAFSLEVRVTHPAEAEVASTVVSVYESNTTTCKAIELGDLSTAELQAILVGEQALGAGPLGDVSRLARKLVVARGFDAMGRFLTAGCTEKEEIAGHDVVAVDTDFAATLSIGAVDPGDVGIPITLTDAEGRSLGGHAVTWRVYGPDGAAAGSSGAALAPAEDGGWELAAPTCTADSGFVQLHPVPPSAVGGYAIAIRPRWPSQPNTLLTSFTRIDPTLEDVIAKPGVAHACALRVAGQARQLVCLQLAAPGGAAIAREYGVSVQDGNARLQAVADLPVVQEAVALFSVERGPTVRDVYAIDDQARLYGLDSPSVAPVPGSHLPAGASRITDAVLLPACDGGQAARLVLVANVGTERRLFAMPAMGGAAADYHGVRTSDLALQLAVRSAGCVAELQPGSGDAPRLRQATVIELSQRVMQSERSTLSVVFECDLEPTRCRASLPVVGGGAGLSPPPRATPGPGSGGPPEEPRITGMFVDASGVVMSSWVLLPTPKGEFLLVERGRVPSASIPNLVVSGHFDGDGRTDMFWDLPLTLQQRSTLQVTYGRTIDGQRLSALSGSEPILVDELLAADVTGDGMDDVVLLGQQRRDQTLARGLIVIPMNVPIPNPDPTFDRPCP